MKKVLKSKNVLILDSLSSIHIGNGVLIDNSIKLIKEINPNVTVNLLSMDPETNRIKYKNVDYPMFGVFWRNKSFFQKIVWIVSNIVFVFLQILNQYTFKISPQKLSFNSYQKRAFDKIKKADVCVSIIGEAINDNFYQALYFWLFNYWITIRMGKRFVLFPQSIGPLDNFFNKFLVFHALKDASLLIARDQNSYKKLFEIGFKKSQIAYSVDVGLLQEVGDTSKYSVNDYFEKKDSKKVIGLTLSKFPGEIEGPQNYLDIILQVVRKEVDPSKYKILILPSNYIKNGVSSDYEICYQAYLKLRQVYEVSILANRLFFPKEYTTLLSQLYFFISTRMHVTIMACSQAIPTIAISSQFKIAGFMENIGQERFVVELERLNELSVKIKNVLQDRDRISSSIKNNVSEQKKTLGEIQKILKPFFCD
ncbi:polysaccharide pyruvyl transferase family protein [Thermophagus sp. OGC60D27]|uniref:polysaccharide pyruvyl transferase family protein n=1 Tax=Thermophagus sp. OGC60D27 TaxID=3458415 RepID=UPI0040382F36